MNLLQLVALGCLTHAIAFVLAEAPWLERLKRKFLTTDAQAFKTKDQIVEEIEGDLDRGEKVDPGNLVYAGASCSRCLHVWVGAATAFWGDAPWLVSWGVIVVAAKLAARMSDD